MAELRRMAAIVGLAVAALGIGSACGADRGPSSEARTKQSSAAPADLVRLVYTEADSDAGTIEIIADGNRRYRLTVVSGAEAGYYQVWDGKVMLIHTPDEGYQREEDPGGGELGGEPYFFRPGTDEFEKTCPKARRVGGKKLYGRNAVSYACAARPVDEQVPEEETAAREIALDEKTGLKMVDGRHVPTEVTFGPAVKADTFSTDLPPGATETAVPPDAPETAAPPDDEETAGPAGLGEFRLPAVGGGYVADTSYRGKALVVVVGSPSSLRVALARVLPLTGGGVKPVVVGVLIAVPPSDWKGSLLDPADAQEFVDSVARTAGQFAVPVGIDVKGAAVGSIVGSLPELIPPEGSTETESAIALVGADGVVAHVLPPEEADDAQLRTWLGGLS